MKDTDQTRMDEVLRRMLATLPQKHKPLGERKTALDKAKQNEA